MLKPKQSRTLCVVAPIIALICILIGTACSSDSERDEIGVYATQPLSPEYSSLLDDLNGYHQKFLESHPQENVISRGLTWNAIKQTLKADFFGYVDRDNVYHQGMSIGSSIKYWADKKKEEREARFKVYELSAQESLKLTIQIDSLKVAYQRDSTNIGAIHNATILSIFLNKLIDYNTNEELMESVHQTLNNWGIQTPNWDNHFMAAKLDEYFNEVFSADDAVMYENLYRKYPFEANRISILKNYYNSIQNFESVAALKEYTTGYVELINSSRLNEFDKIELQSNISIAPASAELWANPIWNQ